MVLQITAKRIADKVVGTRGAADIINPLCPRRNVRAPGGSQIHRAVLAVAQNEAAQHAAHATAGIGRVGITIRPINGITVAYPAKNRRMLRDAVGRFGISAAG